MNILSSNRETIHHAHAVLDAISAKLSSVEACAFGIDRHDLERMLVRQTGALPDPDDILEKMVQRLPQSRDDKTSPSLVPPAERKQVGMSMADSILTRTFMQALAVQEQQARPYIDRLHPRPDEEQRQEDAFQQLARQQMDIEEKEQYNTLLLTILSVLAIKQLQIFAILQKRSSPLATFAEADLHGAHGRWNQPDPDSALGRLQDHIAFMHDLDSDSKAESLRIRQLTHQVLEEAAYKRGFKLDELTAGVKR